MSKNSSPAQTRFPRVLHFSPFGALSGPNRSMLSLVGELVRCGPTWVVGVAESDPAKIARDLGATVASAFEGYPLPRSRVRRWRRITRTLLSEVRKHQIEIIHCHSAMGMRYAYPVAKLTRRPLIAHQRDTYARDYFHLGLGRADHIIAISKWVQESMPTSMRGKSTVVYNAVALPATENQSHTNGRLKVGMAGICKPEKGQDLLIRAAVGLLQAYDFELHVWGFEDQGENSFGRSLMELIRAAPQQVQERILLSPFRADIDAFYSTMDVVVMPSRWREPFGRVAIEAMSWGKPVVAAAHGGLPEIIQDGVNGLLFEPLNHVDLSEKLERLLRDTDLRTRLGDAARNRIEMSFNSETHAREVMALYNRVLN